MFKFVLLALLATACVAQVNPQQVSVSIRANTTTTQTVFVEYEANFNLSVSLASPPTNGSVVVYVHTLAAGCTVDEDELNFTSTNYSTPQIVHVTDCTVSAQNPDYSSPISLTVNATFNPPYNNEQVSILYSSQQNATIAAVSNAVCVEGGNCSFTVVLPFQPTDNIVYDISYGNFTNAAINVSRPKLTGPTPDEITFTPNNWSTPQTINFGTVDDSVYDGNVTIPVTFTQDSGSPDSQYATSFVYNVVVVDNDRGAFSPAQIGAPQPPPPPPGVILSPLSPKGGVISITGNANGQAPGLPIADGTQPFFVYFNLPSQPEASVTVNLDNSNAVPGYTCAFVNPSSGVASGTHTTSITIQPADWQNYQAVECAPIGGSSFVNNRFTILQFSQIPFTLNSADPNFRGSFKINVNTPPPPGTGTGATTVSQPNAPSRPTTPPPPSPLLPGATSGNSPHSHTGAIVGGVVGGVGGFLVLLLIVGIIVCIVTRKPSGAPAANPYYAKGPAPLYAPAQPTGFYGQPGFVAPAVSPVSPFPYGAPVMAHQPSVIFQ